ncbi:MAG: phage BR0599 family protein [Kofleriaceae bacterium]
MTVVAATLALGPPLTASGVLDNVVLEARIAGTVGNAITVEFNDDSLGSGGEIDEDDGLKTVVIKFSDGVTTLADLAALFAVSALVQMTGTWTGTDVLTAGDDEFIATNLAGGIGILPSYDVDEASTEQSRPIELFTVTLPMTTYRFTSAWRDVAFGGETFTAIPSNRGPLEVVAGSDARALSIYLPVAHPLVQRWVSRGIPPGQALLTIERLQQVSGAARRIWDGHLASLAIEDGAAMFRCPSQLDDPLRVRLPSAAAKRTCNHILYDSQCKVDRNSYAVATTIATMGIDPTSGYDTITVASMGGHPTQWAYLGEVVHVLSGERRTILAQASTLLSIDVPIVEAVNGDAVIVYAGCAHDVEQCFHQFNNVQNFGGHPQMPVDVDFYSFFGRGNLGFKHV